jgi:hypothetical protein
MQAIHSGGAVAQLGARLDGIEEVVGSNPIGSTKLDGSSPDTWVIQRTDYMGSGFSSGSSTRFSRSKYPKS